MTVNWCNFQFLSHIFSWNQFMVSRSSIVKLIWRIFCNLNMRTISFYAFSNSAIPTFSYWLQLICYGFKCLNDGDWWRMTWRQFLVPTLKMYFSRKISILSSLAKRSSQRLTVNQTSCKVLCEAVWYLLIVPFAFKQNFYCISRTIALGSESNSAHILFYIHKSAT